MASPWLLNGDAVGSGSTIPGWGYGMALSFAREITIVADEVREATGLGRASRLRLSTAWSAKCAINLGNPSAESTVVSLDSDRAEVISLSIDVPSVELADSLFLVVLLTLEFRSPDSATISAQRIGSILWKSQDQLLLEGRSARMPVLAADFRQLPSKERDSAWYVWTSSDWLHRHVSSGITVYVNASREPLVDALSTRQPDATQKAVQRFFYHDVGKLLIERALDDDEFTDDAEFEKGTCGRSLRSSLRILCGHQTLGQIKQLRKDDGAAFDRLLQVRHKLSGAMP
jgi:hypothetical protein